MVPMASPKSRYTVERYEKTLIRELNEPNRKTYVFTEDRLLISRDLYVNTTTSFLVSK